MMGTWKVFLLISIVSVKDRFIIVYSVIYVDSGVIVVVVDLWNGVLNESIGGGGDIWMGIDSLGRVYFLNSSVVICVDWMNGSSSKLGREGYVGYIDLDWISNNMYYCDDLNVFYCIEQGVDVFLR